MEVYENMGFEREVYFKLKEAEREAKTSSTRFSSKDVLEAAQKVIEGTQQCKL